MSDVFISYARASEEQARQVEEALRAGGYSVWRDTELPVHGIYAEVIEERLKSSKAVVVLWSAEAARSQWVRAEADAARELGTLAQARLDGTIPPMPFNQIQCADLQGWKGDANQPGWRKLEASVAALAGQPREPGSLSQVRRQGKSICVLPFANMSGDVEQEYFSDGISEDITTDLSNISALSVTARNTAFTMKGAAVDVREVSRKLGVSHVLQGSVRKAGARIRISAQLVDGESGDQVWAERFDRDLTDIFAIQDEISHSIVSALKLKLLPEEKQAIEHRGTTNAEAYNLYLMARKFWVTGNHGDMRREQRVVRLTQRSVEIDPDYADAFALMALAQVGLRFYFGHGEEDGQAAADRALSINPAIAEAYAVKARIHLERGKPDAAEQDIATALKLNPDSWEVNREAARIAAHQRKIDDAVRLYERAVGLIESDYHSWALLVSFYRAQGNQEGVRRGAKMMVSQSQKALAEDPSNGAALGICAGGHAILGHREQAMETIERALLIDSDNLNMRYNFACILAGYLSESGPALDLLEPVLAEASGTLVKAAAVDPDLDPLRADARFEEMLSNAKKRLRLE